MHAIALIARTFYFKIICNALSTIIIKQLKRNNRYSKISQEGDKMPRYEKDGFRSKKRIENDKRDRQVPENENYYDFTPVDLNFNNRESEYDDIFDYQVDINNYNPQSDESDNNDYTTDYDDSINIIDKYEDFDSGLPDDKPVKQKQKRNKSKNNKIIAGVAVLLVFMVLPVMLFGSLLGKVNYQPSQPQIDAVVHSDKSVRNILLLGVDARQGQDGEASRADTMMMITLDGNNNCIKLTSFLRDTWVYIPAKDDSQRLNAACSYGGYQGVVDTIEYNFGVDIEGYVVADFELFTVMIDSIGGVEVEVSQEESDHVAKRPDLYGDVTIPAGTNVLDGTQALAYCRIRKMDTDFMRTQRQRKVITSIINKAKTTNPVTLYKMISNVAPYIETSLSKTEIVSLGTKAVSCLGGEMMQQQVPFDNTWQYKTIRGNSVISIDVEKNKELLTEYIYG